MASVMGICGGLVGPKSENVGFSLVLPLLFEGSKAAGARQPNERPGERRRLGGGRGRVNPPPRILVMRGGLYNATHLATVRATAAEE